MNRPLWFATRHALRRAAVPAAIATAIAASGVLGAAARTGERDLGSGAVVVWLQLPLFVVLAACCLAAVEYWPPFAGQRPGLELVRRSARGPLGGGGTAIAGALGALCLLLLPIGTGIAFTLPAAHAHLQIGPHGLALLHDGHTELAMAVGGVRCRELQVRPIALAPAGDPQPTRMQIWADGEPLLAEPVAITATRQLVRIALTDRPLDSVTVRRMGGNLPLLFAGDSVVAVASEAHRAAANAAFALATWLVPALVALLVALCLGPWIALPISFAVTAATLALLVFAELSPAAEAIAVAARGQWLPASPVFRRCIPSLGAGVAAMIAAMIVHRGPRP